MQVTITGGHGYAVANLDFPATNLALTVAESIASKISATFTSAIYYSPSAPPVTPWGEYLIIPTAYASNVVNGEGFAAIVDENSGVTSTIIGGGALYGQKVLASDGGLTFTAEVGDVTVVAGGGNNDISFAHDTGKVEAVIGSGDNTIVGGDGMTSVYAGPGKNVIDLGAGTSTVNSTGDDVIRLAPGGADTVDASGGGTDKIVGSSVGAGAMLTFYGGTNASDITVGAGSATINGGAGGGLFIGGSSGHNSIVAGSGSATIAGGGCGDTLQGGSGNNLIIAAMGNETLGAGFGGSDIFDLSVHATAGTDGDWKTDTITNFSSADKLIVGGSAAVNLAFSTYQLVNGSDTFTLEDGTKVVLENDTHALSMSNFI